MMRWTWLIAACAASVLLGCPGGGPSDAGTGDGGAGTDGGGSDAGDSGTLADAGGDAGSDAGLDAGPTVPLVLDFIFRNGRGNNTQTSIFQVFADGTTFHQEQTCCPQTAVTVDAGIIDPIMLATITTDCQAVQAASYTDAGISCAMAGCSVGHLNCILDGGTPFVEEEYIPQPLRILNIQTTAPEGLQLLHWVDNYVTQALP